jgi:glycosyltransferase involved in cell wall biosynthesis
MVTKEIKRPQVSVVIPTYRWREYILRALESVFAQTFADYEVIVVNDGSPDDVAGGLRPLIESGRIRYVEQPNGGVASARNRGLAEAGGEYLALLDDDDLWPPDSLEWKVAHLKANPAAVLVYGGMSLMHGELPDPEAAVHPEQAGPSGAVRQEFLTRNWLHSPGQALFRTAAVRAIGGFDCGIWGSDDYDLYIRLAEQGEFVYVPRRALYYRCHADNASNNTWRMYCATALVRAKHLGRFPSPANMKTWLANFRFWGSVFGPRLSTGAELALQSGDKGTARKMWWQALRAQPTLLRHRQFRSLGLSLW